MKHKFIHIGDLHLGPTARNADRLAALDQIIAEQVYAPIAAWVLPGDLNHGRMTIEDRNHLVARVTRMADHATVVIAYGNHDLPGDLDFLAKLHAVWPIYVVARPQVIRVPLADGDGTAAIFVLPYPTRAGLVAAGVQSSAIVDAARQALDVIFMSAASELQNAAAQGEIPLAIGHVNVGGSIASSGQPNIGKEIELDPLLIQRLGPIYVGLNHIHRAQDIGGACYAGSVCRLDWGEIEPKGYVVVEYFRDGGGEWAFTRERRPLTVAPMHHIEGTLTRDGFDWRGHYDGETYGPEQWSDFTGAEVRVRFRFAAAEKAALNFDLVTAPFAGAKRIETDPIAEHTRALRAPEVARAQSLDEKVEAFVRGSGSTWTPGLQTKLAALQSPDGAAFLTTLEADLSREEVCQ